MSLVAVVLTYILTKSSADKKIEKFKSLDEALTKTKEEYDSACISRESIIAANATVKRELEKINEETAELQALKGQDDALRQSIQEQQSLLDSAKSTLDELNSSIEKGELDLEELMGDIDLYSRLDEYTAHGHFNAKYTKHRRKRSRC